MKDELISFELAKLAKEVGFKVELNEITQGYLNEDRYCHKKGSFVVPDREDYLTRKQWVGSVVNNKHSKMIYWWMVTVGYITFAPTQSLLQRWFREKHSIHITPIPRLKSTDESDRNSLRVVTGEYHYYIDGCMTNVSTYKTFEEALNEGLIEVCKILKESYEELYV